MRFLAALHFVLTCSAAFAQLIQVSLPVDEDKNKASFQGMRTQALTLPFWEDFSEGQSSPNSARWVNGGVGVSRDMGISPPSLGVATFDGVNAAGKPYSINDVLANGVADSLKSQPIDLSAIPADKRSTVYLSFYYEFWGNVEQPDINDTFSLYFLTSTGIWKAVWRLSNDGTLLRNKFVQVFLPLDDPLYFFSGFQFKFQNRARLSGPYDAWHLDYVYLHVNRDGTEASVPDRTVTSELSGLFNSYYAVPLRHLTDEAMIGKPSFWMYNLREGNIQPMNFNSWAKITTYKKGQKSTADLKLDEARSVGGVEGLQAKMATMEILPAVSNFDRRADSILVFLKMGLVTKDNVEIKDNGDYDPAKYAPIDFRVNDTLRQSVLLQDYYAYDDGTAEYAASLGQAGARMAYRFDNNVKDTIYAVDIYFPEFGNYSNQVVTLELYADKNGKPGDKEILSQTIKVARSTRNKFVTFKLDNATVVEKNFYVGWKQTYAVTVPVGLDKSGDSGDRIFVNTTGLWEQNTSLKGNLMIRPRFGKAPVVTGIEPVRHNIYPQPVREKFFLPADASEIVITDLLGKKIPFSYQSNATRLEITMQAEQGLYIVAYQRQGKRFAEKIVYAGK